MDGQAIRPRMDAAQAERCGEWLARLASWAQSRSYYRAALACEVVRGIVDVDSPEWAAGVAWAGGEPSALDWALALETYGPAGLTGQERAARAHRAAEAATKRDRFATRRAVTR